MEDHTSKAAAFEAIESKNEQSLRRSLLLKCDVNTREGVFKESLLHKAAQSKWANGLILLLEHGCNISILNAFNQTPLQYAVASRSVECVRVLIERGNAKLFDQADSRGHTALHDAAALGLGNIVEELLVAGATPTVQDNCGVTPLHKAITARDINSIRCLLKAGADIKATDSAGKSCLSMLLYSHQDLFESVLNGCFTETKGKTMTESSTGISVDFFPLLSSQNESPLHVIRDILSCGSLKLISHPLCETFLLIQWLNLRKYFVIEVCIYFIFTVFATILILDKFIWIRVDGNFPRFVEGNVYAFFFFIVCIGAALMFLRQCCIIVHGLRLKFISMWYVLNCVIPILVLLVVPGHYTPWQDHIAAITLLLSWFQGMLHIGRFPRWGIYVAMFSTVAKNLVRIFSIFFSLFLAFALSFNVIVFSKHASASNEGNQTNTTETLALSTDDVVYSNFLLMLIKTLTMMTGELNFDEELIQVLNYLPGTSHCIFILFIFLMSIILSNLLVALAVSDVQKLKGQAHVKKLFKQAELAELMETSFEVISTVLKVLSIKRISRKIYSPFLMEEEFKITITTNDHQNQSGSLVIRRHKKKIKIISVATGFVESVRRCILLEKELDQRNKREDAETLDRSLFAIRNDIRLLSDKFSLLLEQFELEKITENLSADQ